MISSVFNLSCFRNFFSHFFCYFLNFTQFLWSCQACIKWKSDSKHFQLCFDINFWKDQVHCYGLRPTFSGLTLLMTCHSVWSELSPERPTVIYHPSNTRRSCHFSGRFWLTYLFLDIQRYRNRSAVSCLLSLWRWSGITSASHPMVALKDEQ